MLTFLLVSSFLKLFHRNFLKSLHNVMSMQSIKLNHSHHIKRRWHRAANFTFLIKIVLTDNADSSTCWLTTVFLCIYFRMKLRFTHTKQMLFKISVHSYSCLTIHRLPDKAMLPCHHNLLDKRLRRKSSSGLFTSLLTDGAWQLLIIRFLWAPQRVTKGTTCRPVWLVDCLKHSHYYAERA